MTNIQHAVVEEDIVTEAEAPVEHDVKRVAQITPHTNTAVLDPRKVTVCDVGIRPQGIPASLPISFKVDMRQAGQSDIDIIVMVCLTLCCLADFRDVTD